MGGLAVNLHGVPRVTQDLDIILSMDRSNVRKFCALMKSLNFNPRLPLDPAELANAAMIKTWVEKKNLKAFSFVHKKQPGRVGDVLLVHPLNFDQADLSRVTRKIDRTELYTVSLNDLIKMKKVSGRKQDTSDIEMLEKAKRLNGNSHE